MFPTIPSSKPHLLHQTLNVSCLFDMEPVPLLFLNFSAACGKQYFARSFWIDRETLHLSTSALQTTAVFLWRQVGRGPRASLPSYTHGKPFPGNLPPEMLLFSLSHWRDLDIIGTCGLFFFLALGHQVG